MVIPVDFTMVTPVDVTMSRNVTMVIPECLPVLSAQDPTAAQLRMNVVQNTTRTLWPSSKQQSGLEHIMKGNNAKPMPMNIF